MTKKKGQSIKKCKKRKNAEEPGKQELLNHFTTSVHTTGHNSPPHGLKFLKYQILQENFENQ